MIKCKEDLYGTHVLLSDKEAAEIYVGLINKFGVSGIVLGGHKSEDAIEVHKADWCASGWDASFTKANSRGLDEGSRRLTLSDLKPKRTYTEYEKVTESIFDLRDEFERGELYYYCCHTESKHKIESVKLLATNAITDNVYRKVEKEIDERHEFVKEASKIWNRDDMHCSTDIFREMYDSGKFKFIG